MSDPKADRALLARVTADVRRHVPGIKTSDGWVNRVGPWHWDFYYGTGATAFHFFCFAPSRDRAKAKGWAALLASMGIDEYLNN